MTPSRWSLSGISIDVLVLTSQSQIVWSSSAEASVSPSGLKATLLVIRGKGRRAEWLRLRSDVGEAIAAYVRDGPPATALDRSLIVRVRAPDHGPIAQIVFAAASRAELGRRSQRRRRRSRL